MKELDEKIWKKFDVFGENGFLHIATTNSSIDSIRLKDGTEKCVPYVTRSESVNGIAQFVSENNYEFGADEAGCITVGLDTQTAFYQPHKFVTGQNIQIVTGDSLNEDSAHFYVTILKKQMDAKFNWGGNGATLSRMKRLEAMLPVSDAGIPDYKYMSEYIFQKRKTLLGKYRNHLVQRIKELDEGGEIPSIAQKKWDSFLISDIFSILPGKRLVSAHSTPGNRPFIGALDKNNGVARFVNDTNASLDKNVLGVNYNGNGMVIGFYHPYECIFSDDVKRFHLKYHEDNTFVLLFMKVAILQQKSKFGYLYKFNAERMANTRIMLPVTDEGTPDYQYMEQYSKNMMLRKYKQYLAYLDSRQNYSFSTINE